MFEVRNLAFSYGRRQVFRDVSFVVSPGEVMAVVGANGAGKTTLMRVLATLAVPDSGQILCDIRNEMERPLKYRRRIGYLPEHVALYDDMSVRDYLTYRAELKGEPVLRVRRRVGEALEACRLVDLARQPIARLSFGYRKRVALADAILLRPSLLLLDDFLAGLDRDMRLAMGDILARVANNSAVIVTGHEIEDLARWATQFLVLRGGVVSATIPAAGVDRADLVARVESALDGGAR